MRKALLGTCIAALPTIGAAQLQLDRMETLSEAMNEAMLVMMANQVAANGGAVEPVMAALPEMAWDDEMRAAGRSMLDEYENRVGGEGADDLLTRMESFVVEIQAQQAAGATMDEMTEPGNILPEGVTQDQSVEITQSCGMLSLQMQRMSASGFTDAMMQAAQ